MHLFVALLKLSISVVDPHWFFLCGFGSSILGQCASKSSSGSRSRVSMTKNCKILQPRKKSSFYINQIAIVEPQASKRTFKLQEKPLALERTSSISNHEISFFLLLFGSYLLSWIKIQPYTVQIYQR